MQKGELFQKAVSFAARAHDGQFRKDNKTPYIVHPFRVSMIARDIFGVTDEHILVAAVLHDTIEDTRTDRDDLIKEFGQETAGWVALLSKDKRLEENYREKLYAEALSTAPDAVKIVKLADIYDNRNDSGSLPVNQRHKGLRRSRVYLKALMKNSGPQIKKLAKIVEGVIAA